MQIVDGKSLINQQNRKNSQWPLFAVKMLPNLLSGPKGLIVWISPVSFSCFPAKFRLTKDAK